MDNRQTRNKRLTIWLLSLLVVGMFGFGFALVPLYNLICQVTGIQSVSVRNDSIKAAALTQSDRQQADDSRSVTIKFDTSVHPNLPWEFEPMQRNLKVHPGQLYQVKFSAHNRSSESITGQAIPSVAPWQATPFLNKLECFCFNQQTLSGGESVEMPLKFMISKDLPKEVRSLTLSYSLMKLQQPAGNGDTGTKG